MTDVLVRICEAMKCDITDIMELSKDDAQKHNPVSKPLPRITPRE